MLRPIEFSLNSPDNVLVGVNAKYSFNSSYTYGQLVLDEFSLTDLRANKGFWANKIGYQLGYKVFDPFNMNRLTLQTEFNYVRPYTYAHHNPQQNYAHYNQPLAHPLVHLIWKTSKTSILAVLQIVTRHCFLLPEALK